MDQSPIGRTSRSNPASYVGALDPLRKRLAATPLARERGYTAGTFSFNAGNGRCPTCGGSGFEHLEMQFLADVYLRCPDCDGRRYRAEVLEVTLRPPGRRPAPVHRRLPGPDGDRGLRALRRPTARSCAPWSRCRRWGWAISAWASRSRPCPGARPSASSSPGIWPSPGRPGRTGSRAGGLLFLLDEPTTGLHFDDIAMLLAALRRLLDQGHSLLVIEHNLDLIRPRTGSSTWGPRAGTAAGRSSAPGPRRRSPTMPAATRGGRCATW